MQVCYTCVVVVVVLFSPHLNLRRPGRDLIILHMAPLRFKQQSGRFDLRRFCFDPRCLVHFPDVPGRDQGFSLWYGPFPLWAPDVQEASL